MALATLPVHQSFKNINLFEVASDSIKIPVLVITTPVPRKSLPSLLQESDPTQAAAHAALCLLKVRRDCSASISSAHRALRRERAPHLLCPALPSCCQGPRLPCFLGAFQWALGHSQACASTTVSQQHTSSALETSRLPAAVPTALVPGPQEPPASFLCGWLLSVRGVPSRSI